MNTQVIEIDEDVYQITTERDDGSVIVETVFGRDAYERHMAATIQGRAVDQGRTAGTRNSSWLWH